QGAKTELEHLKGMVGDGVVKASFLKKGGVILDANRIHACLVVGQDMTIGFIGPEEGNLVFNISETLVPLIREPRAIGVLEE
ncbi:MAG TPA: family 1 encapsulin nanocompartment shell protein, partial [Candidatus Atribacteria bacterium]|nr:family 1 encapsulin nanocompartment shell protein [Candidatus Atribacteria bacterium]